MTWLSSAKMTYVSASKTERLSLSRSGLLSGQTRLVFGADFGLGIPKSSTIPTGPSQGSSGANRWATSATRRRQDGRPFAVDVITGLPFTSQDRRQPCAIGRPRTWHRRTPLGRGERGSDDTTPCA